MRTITVLFLDSLLPGYLAIGAAMLTPDAAGGVRATNSCAVFFWRLPYFTHSPGVKQTQTSFQQDLGGALVSFPHLYKAEELVGKKVIFSTLCSNWKHNVNFEAPSI